MSSSDLKQFKDLYFSDAEETIQRLNDGLLQLEKKPDDPARLDELMRLSHNLKGSSAMMGFPQLAFLTHVLEDVFDYGRNELLTIDQPVVDLVYQTLDLIKKSLKGLRKNQPELPVADLAEKIKKLTGVETEGTGKSRRTADGKPILSSKVKKKTPHAGLVQPAAGRGEIDLTAATEKMDYIKVPVERVDKLMDLTEELLLDRMKLENFPAETRPVQETLDHFHRLVSDIQYQVMQVRLIPLNQVFVRFPRLVRDLSYQMKKHVNFQIIGGELELDRTIVDNLPDPVMHLLRNAIDHGIAEAGNIKLEARRERGFALVSVENDGRPIDWLKVVDAGKRRGIISLETGNQMAAQLKAHPRDIPKEVEQLILHPRLSTKDKVSEVSGRGVGLSVVKSFVTELGGHLFVESPIRGQAGGARFILELPLSLAIIKAMITRVERSVFALPFTSIERTVQISATDIKSMADQDVAVVAGEEIPLVNLKKIFALARVNSAPFNKQNLTLVLTRRGREKAGLVVDEVIRNQEITVKPLPPVIRGLPGFSGSSVLGDGRAILILDLVSLLSDPTKLLRR